ncbi:unspecified product [Leishmania tarentolae]|uniref:Unspecified product n=1 Tax=Leishmania tarentolae TaxID=5689 RepID=A0A640KPQ2_LEITA|nr:unspecified product [Leishmania tarentolae]
MSHASATEMLSSTVFLFVVPVSVVLAVSGGITLILCLTARRERRVTSGERLEYAPLSSQEAVRANDREHRTPVPALIPLETSARDDSAVLGNVLINDVNALRDYEDELVRVDIPNSIPGNPRGVRTPSNGSDDQWGSIPREGVTRSPYRRAPVSTESPSDPETSQHTEVPAYPEDLESGGYVIVECDEPQAPSGTEEEITGGAASNYQMPSLTEAKSVRRHVFYRHRTSRDVYGEAQYYNSPF